MGKGVLAASDRLMQFLRGASANGQRRVWALQLDVASFFPSIHKQTLYAIIARQVRDPEWLWLTRTILFHDPTEDFCFKTGAQRVPPPGAPGYPVPPRKSLFGKGNARGLPIGNLTSQFWANVYLNVLDQFVKRTLKCRYYLRYVDDMVLLHSDPDTLRRWRDEIASFLEAQLKLGLREPDCEPIPASRGIDFVGWKTFWNHRVPRRRPLAACESRLRRFERHALRPLWGGAASALNLRRDRAALLQLRASLASYSGHLRHGAAWGTWLKLLQRHAWLARVFASSALAPWRVRLRWPEANVGGVRFSTQYARLIRHAGERALVFCQVGRFIEFYGPQRLIATRVLRLERVAIGRGGFGFTVGFPRRLAATYVPRAVGAGYTVIEVRAVGRLHARCAARQVVAVYLPTAQSSPPQASWGGTRGTWQLVS